MYFILFIVLGGIFTQPRYFSCIRKNLGRSKLESKILLVLIWIHNVMIYYNNCLLILKYTLIKFVMMSKLKYLFSHLLRRKKGSFYCTEQYNYIVREYIIYLRCIIKPLASIYTKKSKIRIIAKLKSKNCNSKLVAWGFCYVLIVTNVALTFCHCDLSPCSVLHISTWSMVKFCRTLILWI